MKVQFPGINGEFLISPKTDSMLPNLKPGSKVKLFFKAPSFGDVIVFKEGSQMIAHRFLFLLWYPKKKWLLITKGDACLTFDIPHNIPSYVGNLGEEYKNSIAAIKSLALGVLFLPLFFFRIIRKRIAKENRHHQ